MRKTKFYLSDKAGFILQLEKDIAALARKAARAGMRPAVRLNGTSDLSVEKWGLMEKFPNIQFYDYTKQPARARALAAGLMPKNYHLTFSLSEDNSETAFELITLGVNVAAVFQKGLDQINLSAFPAGAKAVNGDLSDLRFLDRAKRGQGVIIALKSKGRAKKDETGFAIPALA